MRSGLPRWPFSRAAGWQARDLELWVAGAAPGSNALVLDLAERNNATATGLTKRFTEYGPALNFTPASSSDIVLPSRQYLDSGSPFTVTWTAYQDALTDTFPAICSLETDGVAWLILTSADASYSDIQIGAPSTWGRFQASFPASSSVTGGWHWGCITYNGAGASDSANYDIYIDGVNIALTGGGGLGAFSGNHIGNLSVAGSRFDGAILDFRVYSRMFSAAEARLLATSERWALYEGFEADAAPLSIAVSAGSGVTVNVPAASVAYTMAVPSVYTGVRVDVPAASVAYTMAVPSVYTGVRVDVPAASVAYTMAVPTVQAGGGVTVNVPAASVAYALAVPSVYTGVRVDVPAASVAYALAVPTVTADLGGVTVNVPAASVAYALAVPSVYTGVRVDVPAASVAYQLYAPTLPGAFIAEYGPVALLNLDIFFNISYGFAERVNLGAVELTGIFTSFNTDGFDQAGPSVRMRQTDVEDNAIVPGSALTIRSDIYHVDARQDDGVGTSLLLLNIRA